MSAECQVLGSSLVCHTRSLPQRLRAMARRALRSTPSCTDDLQDWQHILTEKLSKLHADCFEKRMVLTRTIQEFPALQGVDALDVIAEAAQVAWRLSQDEAVERATSILAAGTSEFEGSKHVCILSWSFTDESLWCGLTDNKNHPVGSQHAHHRLSPRRAHQFPHLRPNSCRRSVGC